MLVEKSIKLFAVYSMDMWITSRIYRPHGIRGLHQKCLAQAKTQHVVSQKKDIYIYIIDPLILIEKRKYTILSTICRM